MKDIPEGMTVYNLEVTPFSTGKIIKTAGSSALISGRDEATGLVFIKMPMGKGSRRIILFAFSFILGDAFR